MKTTKNFLGYPTVLHLIFPLLLGTATLGAQSVAPAPPPARASLAATAAEDVIERSPFSDCSSNGCPPEAPRRQTPAPAAK